MKTQILVLIGAVTLIPAGIASATIIFTPPVNLGTTINSGFREGDPSISADGLTLYFSSTRPGGQGPISIWQSTRPTVGNPFGLPTIVTPLLSPNNDFSPVISFDNLTVYFTSTHESPSGQGNIWSASRASVNDPFGTPALVANVNSPNDDGVTSVSADGLTMYLLSLRPGGQGDYDIWQSTRPSMADPFGIPTNLGSTVNSSSNDGQANITNDGLTLYFSSRRPGGIGVRSIWMTTRPTPNDPFGTPVSLGSAVNSVGEDLMGSVSSDGSTLYFFSDRSSGNGNFDIWTTTVIPEPSTFVLAGLGLVTLFAYGWRRSHLRR